MAGGGSNIGQSAYNQPAWERSYQHNIPGSTAENPTANPAINAGGFGNGGMFNDMAYRQSGFASPTFNRFGSYFQRPTYGFGGGMGGFGGYGGYGGMGGMGGMGGFGGGSLYQPPWQSRYTMNPYMRGRGM